MLYYFIFFVVGGGGAKYPDQCNLKEKEIILTQNSRGTIIYHSREVIVDHLSYFITR